MSQNGHEARSCAERARATDAARRPRPARPVRAHQRRPCRRPQQPPLPLLLHLSAPPSGALPHLPLRPVRPAHQCHGHRQYLRTSSKTTVLRRRMGEKHPLLPRPPSHRPSSAIKARLVRTLRLKRVPVFHAFTCRPLTRGSWSARLAHGGRPSGRLHGPHKDLPRASGEAESAPRRLSGVLLSEGDRPLHDRCVWSVRRAAHRKSPREVAVRVRRILSESVPQPAHPLWKAAPPTAFTAHRQLSSHRAVIFREISGEDAHRDADKGHAAIRELILVAVHGDHVTHDVAPTGGGMIRALRFPAVPAERCTALRLPKVPAGSPGRRRDVIQRVPRQ